MDSALKSAPGEEEKIKSAGIEIYFKMDLSPGPKALKFNALL